MKWFWGAEVGLPFGQKWFCRVYVHAHTRPIHAHGEGDEFEVAMDTHRIQENIHAKFQEHWFSGLAVYREHTHTQTNRQTDRQTRLKTSPSRIRGW